MAGFLDELDKVGTSIHNGNVLDALLGLRKRQSASRWHAPYLEASVDLSQVIWVVTANSVDRQSAPLRDRCRILRFRNQVSSISQILPPTCSATRCAIAASTNAGRCRSPARSSRL